MRDAAPPTGVRLFALAAALALLSPSGVFAQVMPYQLKPAVQDRLLDDNIPAVVKLRKKIMQGFNHTFGIVLVTDPEEADISSITVPIWEAYAERHRFDIVVHQAKLFTSDYKHMWTKLRVYIELLAKVHTWKYFWAVDHNSLPVNFEKSWTYIVKDHMRYMRFRNDKPWERYLFCPEDCERGTTVVDQSKSCYGPLLSGCVFMAKKPALDLALAWYDTREKWGKHPVGLLKGIREVYKNHVYFPSLIYRDIQDEIGRSNSTFLATFDDHSKIERRDKIEARVKKIKILGEVSNEKMKREEAFRLEL